MHKLLVASLAVTTVLSAQPRNIQGQRTQQAQPAAQSQPNGQAAANAEPPKTASLEGLVQNLLGVLRGILRCFRSGFRLLCRDWLPWDVLFADRLTLPQDMGPQGIGSPRFKTPCIGCLF